MANRKTIFGIIMGLGAGVAAIGGLDLYPKVDAQAGGSTALDDIAPATGALSSTVDADADTTTALFRYDNLGAAFAAADLLPIPDGEVCTITALPGGGCCRCGWISDSAHTIGAQSGAGTRRQINGADQPSMKVVCSSGVSSVPIRADFDARQSTASRYTGVCDTETAHNTRSDLDVYLTCDGDADCQNIAGTPGTATCIADRDQVLAKAPVGANRRVPSDFLGCRCDAATTLDLECERR